MQLWSSYGTAQSKYGTLGMSPVSFRTYSGLKTDRSGQGAFLRHACECEAAGQSGGARIHPRETFRRAVIEGSFSIIVAHNHPTGDVTPSDGDIRTTRKLHDAGELLQIPLLDHIIFTAQNGQFFSFKDNSTHSSHRRKDK